MKKTLLFVACIFAFVGLAQAQGNKISWGADFDTKEKVENLVGETEEAVFGLGFAEYGEYKTLFIFDSKTLNLTQEKKLDLPKIDGKKPKVVGAKVFGGKCYVFALVGSDSKGALYAISVDAKGAFANNPKKIFEQQKLSINHLFLFQLSDDKSHLLVSLLNIFDTAWGVALYYPAISSVFEENFELVHTVTPKPNDSDKYSSYMFRRATIDNNGNIFFLFHKGTDYTLHSYEVFNYSVDKQAFSYSIDPAKVLSKVKEATSLTMDFFEINAEGDLCMGGYYLRIKKVGGLELREPRGTFYCKIDNENNKIALSEVSPFSKETINEAAGGNGDLISKGVFTKDFATKSVIVKDDGGIVLLSENFDGYDSYGSVVITSFSKLGEVEWTRVIPKTQITVNEKKSKYYSIGVGSDGKSINVYYNDNSIGSVATNAKEIMKIRMEDIEDLKLALVTIGYDGKDYDKKELGNAVIEGVAIFPKSMVEGKKNSVLQLGEYKKVKKLGRIKL